MRRSLLFSNFCSLNVAIFICLKTLSDQNWLIINLMVLIEYKEVVFYTVVTMLLIILFVGFQSPTHESILVESTEL